MTEAYPGPDGLTRVIIVKTAVSSYRRPVVKLVFLPVHESGERPDGPIYPPTTESSHGRRLCHLSELWTLFLPRLARRAVCCGLTTTISKIHSIFLYFYFDTCKFGIHVIFVLLFERATVRSPDSLTSSVNPLLASTSSFSSCLHGLTFSATFALAERRYAYRRELLCYTHYFNKYISFTQIPRVDWLSTTLH